MASTTVGGGFKDPGELLKASPEEVAAAKARIDAAAARSQREKVNGSAPLDGEVLCRSLSEIRAVPVNWLWGGKIARGKISFIAGNPGLGKSQVTCSIAAIVSTGGRWPVDRTNAERGHVVIMSAEDDPADTIKPRLMAAGCDPTRVHVLDAVVKINTEGRARRRSFDLQRDLDRFSELFRQIGDVALLIIDPISAYLGKMDSHKNAEVRASLAEISDMAASNQTAVICVSHLNKGGSNDPLMRVTGSLGFVAHARAAFGVAKDPNDPARRLMLPLKNNLGEDETGMAFRVESHTVDTDGQQIPTSRVSWESEPVTETAAEIMGEQPEFKPSKVEKAELWLEKQLADGPVLREDLKARGLRDGISWASLRRAKDAVKVVTRKRGYQGATEWFLLDDAKMLIPKVAQTHIHPVEQVWTEPVNTGPEVMCKGAQKPKGAQVLGTGGVEQVWAGKPRRCFDCGHHEPGNIVCRARGSQRVYVETKRYSDEHPEPCDKGVPR